MVEDSTPSPVPKTRKPPSVVVRWRRLLTKATFNAADLRRRHVSAHMVKAVAYALSDHMNEAGGSCFPSLATLAREAGASVKAVRRALVVLEEDSGHLHIDRSRGRRSHQYTAILDPSNMGTMPTLEPDSGTGQPGHDARVNMGMVSVQHGHDALRGSTGGSPFTQCSVPSLRSGTGGTPPAGTEQPQPTAHPGNGDGKASRWDGIFREHGRERIGFTREREASR